MPKGEVLPDCGSICALLTAAGGAAPTTIGKPNRRMLDLLSAQTGVPTRRSAASATGSTRISPSASTPARSPPPF
jgi:ribonucleotide monophosphatase NagD (HAD superfamily)